MHDLKKFQLPFVLGSIFSFLTHSPMAATISFVGSEEGSAGNGYAVQNWSNAGVAKGYDLAGEKYGTAGYYQIRPMAWDPGAASIYEGVSAGNNLGTSAASNPTFSSTPIFLSSLTGAAGSYVNFGGYPIVRGPDGSALYRQGSLSVSVNQGPYSTPSGSGNGYFGDAFSFTMGSNMGATFRIGVGVDTAGNGSYAPDYVSLYSGSTGTVYSSQLSRNGSMDMAFFDVSAAAGESIYAAVWQVAGTQSVAPFGLITFDTKSYDFNVASGTQTNSTALGGAPSALVKTGNGTLVVTSSNNYGGGTLISGGTLKLEGGSVSGNITNNANLAISADLGNAVSGAGSLTKQGAGTASLWTANSYSGATVVEAGQLRLDGSGAISSNSVVQVASGASFSATGIFKTSNDLTIAGLTGAGQFYNAHGNVTVNKSSGTDIFSGEIAGETSLTKAGAGTLALGGASTYTGATTVSAGVLLLADGSGLGSTVGGTTVASGAVLRLTNATGMTVGNEALTISGNGVSGSGGALRSVGGTNTWQGKVSLAAASTIGAASGASLTLDVASGNAVEGNNLNLTLDGAGTIQINDAISLGTGGLTKNGSGTHYLSANNSYSGGTTVGAGRLVVSGAGRLGSGAISVANANGGTLEFAVTGNNLVGNSISGNGALLSSSGVTQFDGAVTSTGGLTVNSSTVKIGSTGSLTSSTSTVNNGGTLDVAGSAGNVQLNSGGTLKGSGSVSALTIASGGTLAPGNSPGTLTASSATWNGGGTYAWEINNFLGSAGTNYDFLNVTGSLTISASSGNKFIIDVISLLAASNTAGNASNFDAWSNYSFSIATAAGGISGFNASSFDILTNKFSNSMLPAGATGAGSWSVSQVGNSINLNYAAAIPEPSTVSLMVLGLAALLKKRRR